MSAGPDHANVARYKRMMAAFNQNDLSTIEELVANDVEYVVPGKSLIAGHTTTLSSLLDMLRRSKELSGNTLRLETEAVLADDRFLFVYGRIHAERSGRQLDSPHCVVFEFQAGKIVAGRTVPTDLYAFDHFWS
ncbi:MAG TPA: nuclear transport factor 2 family protein [Polyangiaceae bacterium]|nr:nuclear transport factor 2 family protein [Polyangiaceae bacterium]